MGSWRPRSSWPRSRAVRWPCWNHRGWRPLRCRLGLHQPPQAAEGRKVGARIDDGVHAAAPLLDRMGEVCFNKCSRGARDARLHSTEKGCLRFPMRTKFTTVLSLLAILSLVGCLGPASATAWQGIQEARQQAGLPALAWDQDMEPYVPPRGGERG